MDYTYSEEYQRIGEEVMRDVPELNYLLDADIRVAFVASKKAKKRSKNSRTCGECVKVQELYKAFTPYDFLIVFYEPNIQHMNEAQLRILAEHELLHIGYEEGPEGPRYSIVPHDYEDFKQIIDKYGTDWDK